MCEIDDRDLEQALGGFSLSALHGPSDCCENFEPKPNAPTGDMFRNCDACAHCRVERQLRLKLGKVICELGINGENT